jgi:hypothetical protein
VHPLRQSRFLPIQRLGPSDVLPACLTCLTHSCTALAAKLKFQLGEASEYAGFSSETEA